MARHLLCLLLGLCVALAAETHYLRRSSSGEKRRRRLDVLGKGGRPDNGYANCNESSLLEALDTRGRKSPCGVHFKVMTSQHSMLSTFRLESQIKYLNSFCSTPCGQEFNQIVAEWQMNCSLGKADFLPDLWGGDVEGESEVGGSSGSDSTPQEPPPEPQRGGDNDVTHVDLKSLLLYLGCSRDSKLAASGSRMEAEYCASNLATAVTYNTTLCPFFSSCCGATFDMVRRGSESALQEVELECPGARLAMATPCRPDPL